MRVLLINPRVPSSYYSVPPLGLGYIASQLKEHEEVEILDENQFGWGIEMVKAKNSGFVYMVYDAPHFTGPLFMLTLLLDRLCRRKQEL